MGLMRDFFTRSKQGNLKKRPGMESWQFWSYQWQKRCFTNKFKNYTSLANMHNQRRKFFLKMGNLQHLSPNENRLNKQIKKSLIPDVKKHHLSIYVSWKNENSPFVTSQFGCCRLVWMFHIRGINNKINSFNKRALRITYGDRSSSFQDLLEKGNSVSTHHRNIQTLANEMLHWKL